MKTKTGENIQPTALQKGLGARSTKDSTTHHSPYSKTAASSFTRPSGSSLLLAAISCIFMVLLVSLAAGQQLPLPIESARLSGDPSWIVNTTNLLNSQRNGIIKPDFGDIDADGDYDMFLGTGDGLIEYWRNDGNVTSANFSLQNSNIFGDFGDYAAPYFYDADKDGDLDLYVGANNGGIYYYKNEGTPTSFQYTGGNAIDYWGGHLRPLPIDYNKDGAVDIIYGRNNDAVLYKIKNDGFESGIAQTDFEIARIGGFPTSTLVDIDNDGDQDVFVGVSSGNVLKIENKGTATTAVWSEPSVQFDAGDYVDIAFSDLDNDADLDMTVGNQDGTLKYYRNDGTADNAFWTLVPNFYGTIDAGDYAAPAFADVDTDGDIDMVVGNNAGASNYYRNQGSATAPNFVLSASLIPATGARAQPVFVDADADGDKDLAVGRSDGYVQYFRNVGPVSNPAFVANGSMLVDWYDYATPTFGDINGDGDLDMISGAGSGYLDWVSIIPNEGTPQNFFFDNTRKYSFDNEQRQKNCDYADADGDGDFDRFCGREDGWWHYQPNEGTPQEPKWPTTKWFFEYYDWSRPSTNDLNGDGHNDIALGGSGESTLRYYASDSHNTAINFTQTDSIAPDLGSWSNPDAADLDNDGDLDLIVGYQDGILRYFVNNGSITTPVFAYVTNILDIGDFSSPDLGDLDGDGDLDMVVGRSNDPILYYYQNTGTPSQYNFSLGGVNFLGNNCRPGDGSVRCDPQLVDFDNDGDLDLLVTQDNAITRYWRNDGNPQIATWADQGDIIGDIGSYGKLAVADFNSDTKKDILIVDGNTGQNYFYRNEGVLPLYSLVNVIRRSMGGNPEFIPDLGTYVGVEFADLNADGAMDVIAGEEQGQLTLLRNNGVYTDLHRRALEATFVQRSGNIFSSNCHPSQGTGYCLGSFRDFDSDGDQDVILVNYYREPYYWRNDGSSTQFTFTPVGLIGGGDIADGLSMSSGDLDGDGDYDVIYSGDNGLNRFLKNIGGPTNPVFTTVYRGHEGRRFLPDFGEHQTISFVDINADNKVDFYVSASPDGSNSNSNRDRFIKNGGLFTDAVHRANDPTYVSDGPVLNVPATYNAPTGSDFDGDGDIDLLVGDVSNVVRYYLNDGSGLYNLGFQVFDIGNNYGSPAAVDLDGDGAIDFAHGDSTGFIRYLKNIGSYTKATTITLLTNGSTPVQGANVQFIDGSGTVCVNTTNAAGKTSCLLTFVGGSGSIIVSGGQPGDVSLGILSPTSTGRTFMTLESGASNFVIELRKLTFNAFNVATLPAQQAIEIADKGTTVFTGTTDSSGYIDGYFPRKYLVNKMEPYTQNRVTYDVNLRGGTVYDSDLLLRDVYAPNELRFGSNVESQKLYKFLATHEMSSDAQYKEYVIYPALTAQRNYQLVDSLPAQFHYAGNAEIQYRGSNQCSFAAPNSSTINIPFSQCSFLSQPVGAVPDWLVYSFTVRTPGLDYFITQGINSTNFVIPPASLNLLS